MPKDSSSGPAHVTQLLDAWQGGDLAARDAIVPLVYEDLRNRANRYMYRENAGHTLRPSDVVHEAWLRLAGQNRADWKNRSQFLGVAAEMMRRVLIDYARGKASGKRGGSWQQVSLEVDALADADESAIDLLALDAALEDLRALDPRKERLVELRYFGGLSIEEAAENLEISPATAKRDWLFARAWLYDRLKT